MFFPKMLQREQKGLFKFVANCSPVIASLSSSPRFQTRESRISYSSTFVSQLTSGKLAPGYLHKCLLVPLLSLNKWIAGVAKGGRKTCPAIWPTLSYMRVRGGNAIKIIVHSDFPCQRASTFSLTSYRLNMPFFPLTPRAHYKKRISN